MLPNYMLIYTHILFLMIICITYYRLGRRKNYAFEGINLQVQLQYFLSERLWDQVTWGRFGNVKGLQGHNISCDLYLEHLNRFVYIDIILLNT